MSVILFPKKKPNLRRKFAGKPSAENEVSCLNKNVTLVKRDLFNNVQARKRQKLSELSADEVNENLPFFPRKLSVKLSKQDTSAYQSAKRVFHTSVPPRLIGRDKEINEITNFLTYHISNRKSGSLYISGAPGTGKTSCLMYVLNEMKVKHRLVFINSMTMSNPSSVFSSIASELLPQSPVPTKNILNTLEKFIISSDTMNVLVLDEIDQLDNKGQEILYSLFEWPQLPNSSVIIVGIANALDLTDRVLPRLQRFKCEPTLMHFQPYSRAQICAIIEDRLSQVQGNSTVISSNGIQLCARKIASCTGDVRKALDVCRRAIELAEKQSRQQMVLTTSADDRCNPGSPCKRATPVDLQQINSVLQEVYGSRLQTDSRCAGKETVTLPLQQVMALCTVALVRKHCKDKDVNLGKVYDIYRRICKKRQIAFIGESEFHVVCQLVESRGFIHLKNSKMTRMRKISLNIEDGELEHVLQDKSLLSSILSDSSVLSNNS